jgi:hypothetical protein
LLRRFRPGGFGSSSFGASLSNAALIGASRGARQFASYSMLTGTLEDSNGTFELISTPATKAAMAITANVLSTSAVNTFNL